VRRYARELDHGADGAGVALEQPRWYTVATTEVVARLSTSVDQGLSTDDAIARLARFGANRWPTPQPRSPLATIAGHLTSMPVLLLGGAAALSIASGALLDAAVILSVVAANAGVGYVTERRVERILTSLQQTAVPQATTRRDGREVVIPASALVPGDVMVLKAGHDVPADGRVVFADGLNIDESALTGESVPVGKRTSIVSANGAVAGRINMVHAETVVADGSGIALVTATGRHTEMGQIRALVAETTLPATPLERQLERTGRRLVAVSLGACAAALGLGLLRGVPGLEMARSAISLAVAAVPEGLPAVATTTLALGMQTMMRRGTLVRRLAAVESLGAVTVLCADKTGTLTENRMTVDSWSIGTREYGQGPELAGERASDAALDRALSVAVLCNEAELSENGGDGNGSSTETALLSAARQAGLDYRAYRRRYPLRSIRRRTETDNWMATVHADGLVAVKGAPEEVIARADRWIDDGVEQPLDAAARRALLRLNDRIAARGLRLLGLAFKESATTSEPDVDGLIFVGLVALTDPVRPGVGEAMRACRAAGIRTVLITGDHARTAAAIYQQAALGDRTPTVFDGAQVGDVRPESLPSVIRDVDVFARVSPADKYRIVRALQAAGEVVAMTGDGINDAAALRAADIGVAMGARGTDVARDVADVVLVTDDFAGIVAAVEQGRAIHANVGKALRFLLATNFSEILVTLGAMVAGAPRPMSAIQFLWINLLSDVAPALALAVEPAEPDIMSRPPRDPAEPMLSRGALLEITRDAGVLAVTTLAVHGLAVARYGAGARSTTLAFSTLTTAQLLQALAYRSGAPLSPGRASRSPLFGVVAASVAAQIGGMAFPALRRVLGLTPMSPSDWALVGGAACIPAVVNEIRRDRRRGGPSAVSSPIQGEMHGSTQGNGQGPGSTH
jgi:Ca2+-transporting ATPase